MRKERVEKKEQVKSLGLVLCKGRKAKGFTQLELGNMIGVDATTISSYERDRTRPDGEKLCSLINVLDIPYSEIIDFYPVSEGSSDSSFKNSILGEIVSLIRVCKRGDQELILNIIKRFRNMGQ